MNSLYIKGLIPVVKPLAKWLISKGADYCKTLEKPIEGYNRIIQAIQNRDDDKKFIILIIDMNPETLHVSKVHYKNEFIIDDENLEDFLNKVAKSF